MLLLFIHHCQFVLFESVTIIRKSFFFKNFCGTIVIRDASNAGAGKAGFREILQIRSRPKCDKIWAGF
jgi:hypothetical protein